MNRQLLIYVENISPSSNEESLVNYLQKWAPVLQVYFLREKQCTKRSFAGFIRVASESDLLQILDKNQQNYRGKRLFMLRTDQPQFFQADQTIIVRNINAKMSEENIYEHFEDCGIITHVQIRTDDFAYVGFHDKNGAKNAMAKNNLPLKNTNLKIQLLTRNVEIMIVNLDTLQKTMPQLHRELCMPIQPKTAAVCQQQENNVQQNQQVEQQEEQQPQRHVEQQPQRQAAQQQQQNQQRQQPNQQRQQQNQRQPQNQWQQQNQQRQQQQNQQRQQQNQQRQQQENQQKQQENQPREQEHQQRPQQNQQRQQQNQQSQQQNQPWQQPNQQKQQQNQNPRQQQQQRNQQQANQPKQNIWQKKEPLNQPPLPQRVQKQQQQEMPKAQNQLPPATPSEQPVNGSNAGKAVEEPDVIMLDPPVPEVPAANKVDDDADEDVQFVAVENPDLPPIPSEYQPQPDDILRPVKASEVRMIDAEVKDPSDRRSVWVNNIPGETRRLELIEYMEQFGSVINCKVKPSTCSYYTKWAKVTFISEEIAEKATEYFLHPFRGHYLFVLPCKLCVEETPERTFVIDYLTKYTTYEEVAAAFKHVGEVYYLVRLYGNSFKSRIFFTKDVKPEDVLAVKAVNGIPINVERFSKGMALKNPKSKLKELIASREKVDEAKKERLKKINEINLSETSAPCIPRLYNNRDPEKHPVEVMVENVPKGTSDKQIYGLFRNIGQPISIRREPEPNDRTVERVFVGYNTLSKALKAAEISPETILRGHNLFIYTAWTTATKSQNNTLLLKLADTVTIQAIYNEMSRFGRVRYIQMDSDKQATVIFFGTKSGPVVSARSATAIGNVKILSKVRLMGTVTKQDAPIVIDDEVEIVAIEPANSGDLPASNVSSKDKPPQKQQQMNKERQSNQKPTRGAQKPKNDGPCQNLRSKFRNPFSEQQQQQRPSWRDGPYQQQQQQQINPWNNPNFRMDDPPMRQFDRNDHGQWQDQRMQNDQFDRFNDERNMNQFERPLPSLMDDDFNRGAPMEFDDRWNQQRQFSNQQQFSPPRQRSPFDQNFRRQNWNDGNRGRESPLNIPPNISDDDIDTYIMQKQLAIERRLEQLDKQLITSVDSRRSRIPDDARRRRNEIIFSDNGDVHYVPNPAARFRDNRRPPPNRNRQNGRGRNAPIASRRTHDPFEDIEQVSVNLQSFDDRPPSPKRIRNYQQEEDDFDAERFNAAWC